jgi:hypothetical protein
VGHSNKASLNGLSNALVRSALLPGESLQDLAWMNLEVLLASGLRLRYPDNPAVWETPGQIRQNVESFRNEIEEAFTLLSEEYRVAIIQNRLYLSVFPEAGTNSPADAVQQAGILWRQLDEVSKSTFALALLMLRGSRPDTWPLVIAVILYALDPRPQDLPTHPWG